MKTLKFREPLSRLILKNKKDSTWRLFDDKNLTAGDVVSFLVWETNKEFAKAEIISTKETTFGQLTTADRDGHEKFSSDKEMYETYAKYYNRKIKKDSPVKIIRFKLL